jgi:hypothetical protein
VKIVNHSSLTSLVAKSAVVVVAMFAWAFPADAATPHSAGQSSARALTVHLAAYGIGALGVLLILGGALLLFDGYRRQYQV